MRFDQPLVHGTFINRYKRFLTEVLLDNGKHVMAHCTNSGTMKSCLEAGAEVYLSENNNPARKTRYTWEMIKINNNWVGINTLWPNEIAYEAIKANRVKQLPRYNMVKREVKFNDSRFDIYCECETEKCFIEVKNVTYKANEYALFPDAVTTRGQKHLNTLIEVKKQGMRAVMLYIIQRMDVNCFGPATHIDSDYSKLLKKAVNQGIEIIALQARVTPQGIEIAGELPVDLNT